MPVLFSCHFFSLLSLILCVITERIENLHEKHLVDGFFRFRDCRYANPTDFDENRIIYSLCLIAEYMHWRRNKFFRWHEDSLGFIIARTILTWFSFYRSILLISLYMYFVRGGKNNFEPSRAACEWHTGKIYLNVNQTGIWCANVIHRTLFERSILHLRCGVYTVHLPCRLVLCQQGTPSVVINLKWELSVIVNNIKFSRTETLDWRILLLTPAILFHWRKISLATVPAKARNARNSSPPPRIKKIAMSNPTYHRKCWGIILYGVWWSRSKIFTPRPICPWRRCILDNWNIFFMYVYCNNCDIFSWSMFTYFRAIYIE